MFYRFYKSRYFYDYVSMEIWDKIWEIRMGDDVQFFVNYKIWNMKVRTLQKSIAKRSNPRERDP